MGLLNGSQNNNEQEYDPNLQSFLTPYSPTFFLLDKNKDKNKTLKSVLEESLNENLPFETNQKSETTTTESE